MLQFPVGLSLSSTRSGISGNRDYASGMRSYPRGLTMIFGIWHFVGIQKIVLKGSKQVWKLAIDELSEKDLGNIPAQSELL